MKTLLFTTILAFVPSLIQAGDHGAPKYVEGELLVKFRGGPTGRAAQDARRDLRHEVKHNFDFIGWQHIRLPQGMSAEEGVKRYRAMPSVLEVEPNGIAEAATANPNDPMFGQQYAMSKIAASNAWNVSIGSSNVVVAVIDSGINYNHEDLRDSIWRNPGEIAANGIDDDGNGYVDDIYGIDRAEDEFGNDSDPLDMGITAGITLYHGSACAGIIGAAANNARGIAGLNWSVQLMAVRVLRATNYASFAEMIHGLEYCVLMKQRGINLRVVNLSIGGPDFSQAAMDAHAAVGDLGILQVTSAGNKSTNNDVAPHYPSNYDVASMIAVANSDQNDNLWTASSYGATNVDLAAPGRGIQTVSGPGTNAYVGFNGTSAAAPHVAGAAALLFAAYPSATALEVKAALLDSVDQLPAFTNKMVSHGRLNVGRAMQMLGERLTNAAPNITFQPQSDSVVLSNDFALSATVTGTRPLSFQWLMDNAPVADATNVTLSRRAEATDTGDYVLVISNSFGVATSAVAHLEVITSPLFTSHPQSRTLPETSNATLTGTVIGYAPQSQWFFNGTELPGATSTNLILTNIAPSQAGNYVLVATNAFGAATSAVAVLSVLTFPRVVEPIQPLNIIVVPGETITLGLRTTGSLPIGYRWRRTNPGSVTLTNLVLNDNESLFTFVAATNSGGSYSVILTNAAQPFSSLHRTNAFVTILADTDADGLPDNWEADYAVAGDPDGDADGDGMTNLAEYRAGTNPTNASDNLRIDSLTVLDGTVLRWIAKSNKTYTVQYRALVESGAWTRLTDVMATSSNREAAVMDLIPSVGNRFYRLVTPRIP